MSNQDMITAILNAIQTDENVIILVRALITGNIPNVPTATLQAAMQALGLTTT